MPKMVTVKQIIMSMISERNLDSVHTGLRVAILHATGCGLPGAGQRMRAEECGLRAAGHCEP